MDSGSYNMSSSMFRTQDRINRITQKMSDINSNLESGKVNRMEQINRKINELENRLSDNFDNNSKHAAILREDVSKIYRTLEESKQYQDLYADQKQKEVKQLEMRILERFEMEAQSRKEMELKLFSIIDEKSNIQRGEISKEANTRFEEIEQIKNCLENDIPKLQEAIRTENLEREELDADLVKRVNAEIQQLHTGSMEEKKNREETEEAMLEMLRDMVNRMKGEIENERKDRECTEETLLTLLEDTCTKLTSATNQL